jgi:hypothetical protein
MGSGGEKAGGKGTIVASSRVEPMAFVRLPISGGLAKQIAEHRRDFCPKLMCGDLYKFFTETENWHSHHPHKRFNIPTSMAVHNIPR